MPYIEPQLYEEAFQEPRTPGELNYKLAYILNDSFTQNDPDPDEDAHVRVWRVVREYTYREMIARGGLSYGLYNEVMGVLACAIQEHKHRRWPGAEVLEDIMESFYTTDVRPYEDLKIEENGDLPWLL